MIRFVRAGEARRTVALSGLVIACAALASGRGGSVTAQAVMATGLLCIPASLLGTRLGLALYRRISDAQFARMVNLLLIVSGTSYLL